VFTRNEQVTIMSLWSMLPSPLMYGGNPARLSSDAWTVALLTNPEVMAVNQDVLGARGKRMAAGANEIWVRDLSGGRKAVAFFNRGTQDATMSATFSTIGVTGTPVVRDLWRRADVTGMTTGLSASVPDGAAADVHAVARRNRRREPAVAPVVPGGPARVQGGAGGRAVAAPEDRRAPRAAAGGAGDRRWRRHDRRQRRPVAAAGVTSGAGTGGAAGATAGVREPVAVRAAPARRQRRCEAARPPRRRQEQAGRSRRRDIGRRRDDWRRFGSRQWLRLLRRAWPASADVRAAGAGRAGCAGSGGASRDRRSAPDV
jgi:hypothetical protein